MTWVVGTPTAFGYACGISDIRAKLPDGILDCVQKIYPVGADIAAAFAGSVRLGFDFIEDLRICLGHLEDPSRAWKPRAVATLWHRRARRLYGKAPDSVKKLSAQIMLLGVSPREHIGLPGLALATVAIMRSPQFIPRLLQTATIDSIGSGGDVTVYADMLRRISTEPSLWQAEMSFPGAYGKMVRHVLQQTIEKNPDPGVSPHVHLCTVRRGEIEITTSDYDRSWSSGKVTEWRMPPVATTWAEFETMTQQAFGARSDASVAMAALPDDVAVGAARGRLGVGK